MRRRRVWVRRITRAAGTLAIGLLLGFLVPTVAAEMSPETEVEAQVAESAVARQFIDAYIAGDAASLDQLRVPEELKLRAARLKADYPVISAPTHLGSYVQGPITLHAYSAHVVDAQGTPDLIAWRVVTAAGQVIVLDPPGTLATP